MRIVFFLSNISTITVVQRKNKCPLCEVLFIADKKGEWKLIFVKAHLKYMRVCVVWGNTKCVILIVEAPPYCLCVNWSTYRQALRPRPSIPPSFCCPPTHPPRGSVSLSQVSLSTAALKMGMNWCGIYPQVWSRDLLFYALVGTEVPHLGCVASKRKHGWGEGEAERQLRTEVASSRLGPQRRLLSATAAASHDESCWLNRDLKAFFPIGSWTAVCSSRQDVRFICFPWGINIGFLSTKR